MQALIRMKISGVTFSWGIPSFPSKLLAYSVYRSSTPLIYSAQTLPPLCKYLNGRLYHTAFALILQEVMQEPESFCVKTAGILPAAIGGIVSYGIDKMSSVKNVLDAQAEAVFKACRERVTDTTIQSLIFFWLIETKDPLWCCLLQLRRTEVGNERYIDYYNERRIKEKPGWKSTVQYRLFLLAATIIRSARWARSEIVCGRQSPDSARTLARR